MAGSRGNEDAAICLSDLPDEILLHILSFLPTKSAVATSLLSRRWQHLWTSTPNLQLHEFINFKNRRSEFINFAKRALLDRGGSSLVSFSLKCRVGKDASRIKTWITSAIRYKVEQLSLWLDLRDSNPLSLNRPSLILPYCMFRCQTLVKLDLFKGGIRVSSTICLPRLKHLKLTDVEFADNESAENLLSHPLLEELILRSCVWYNVMTVNVNSPKLQSLTIEDGDDWLEERQVIFIGDNLKFFRYECDLPPTQYCICGSTMQLSEAEILVEIPNHEVQDLDGPSNRYCKLVNQLSMVQTLTLSDAAVQSLYLLSQCSWLQVTLQVLERVTRLNLIGSRNPEQISVPSMICLPQLKHLAVECVRFLDNKSTEKLLSHPLLEELIISDCNWGNVTAVNVNSPMLQSLKILDYDDEHDWSEERQVYFSGGNLRFFRYMGELPPTQYCICGSTLQLSEAEILVRDPSHEIQNMDGPANRYCKLVNSLSMVQTLTLSDGAVQSLYLLNQCLWLRTALPVFERVTRLNLCTYYNQATATMHIDYMWLRKIFKRCPQLEHLNFMQAVVFNSSTGCVPLLRPMPYCFRTHLKKITIQRYYPKRKEQAEAIYVLLYSAMVLEEMILHCKRDVRISGEDSMVAELECEFKTCPYVSEKCRVSIVLV